jgi:hypothetical protein
MFKIRIKYIWGALLTSFCLVSFSPLENSIITLEEVKPLFGGGGFTAPSWLNDNKSQIVATQKGFTGLYLFDLDTKIVSPINTDLAAGYKYQILDNGYLLTKYAITKSSKTSGFRRIEGVKITDPKTKKVLLKEELNTSRVTVLEPYIEGKSLLLPVFDSKDINYFKINSSPSRKERGFFDHYLIYYTDKGIVLNDKKGDQKLLSGQYGIDPVKSPDGNFLCFNDYGTLKLLDQNNTLISVSTGLNATWTPDSKYLIFQQTEDDGEKITRSELYAYELKTKKIIQLTDTEDIQEEYPSISADGKSIVFSDIQKGLIFTGQLKKG